jgi:hypothetical protein
MRPPVPDELYEENRGLPEEGMMFSGSKGKILAGFHVDNPRLIPEKRMAGKTVQKRPAKEKNSGILKFLAAIREGKQCPGSFREAAAITEAVNLYAVALRSGNTLKYDAVNRKITNDKEAGKYLNRNYRNGWEPENI